MLLRGEVTGGVNVRQVLPHAMPGGLPWNDSLTAYLSETKPTK